MLPLIDPNDFYSYVETGLIATGCIFLLSCVLAGFFSLTHKEQQIRSSISDEDYMPDYLAEDLDVFDYDDAFALSDDEDESSVLELGDDSAISLPKVTPPMPSSTSQSNLSDVDKCIQSILSCDRKIVKAVAANDALALQSALDEQHEFIDKLYEVHLGEDSITTGTVRAIQNLQSLKPSPSIPQPNASVPREFS